ncbi:transposase family protein [Streptomyces collinus]|uniref:transposase family protein n=1 Tax=Streptomyces collinus TaxID=42684 RepID=UPI00331D14C5
MTKKWARAALSHPAFTGVSRRHSGNLIEELATPWCALREAALQAAAAYPGRRVLLRRGRRRHPAHRRHGDPGPPPRRPAAPPPRRPAAHRPGRRAFVSGKKKQNTIKTTTISDGQGRTLWNGADRPGRMHEQTAMRTEGIAEQLRLHPGVKAEVDEGYRGLANEFPSQVTAPPKKPKDDAPEGDRRAWQEKRRRQSSGRIAVEHANAEMRHWRPLQRYTGHREAYTETHRAIAGLVSDRAARRPTRPAHSTELVLARQTAC